MAIVNIIKNNAKVSMHQMDEDGILDWAQKYMECWGRGVIRSRIESGKIIYCDQTQFEVIIEFREPDPEREFIPSRNFNAAMELQEDELMGDEYLDYVDYYDFD